MVRLRPSRRGGGDAITVKLATQEHPEIGGGGAESSSLCIDLP